MRRTKELAGQWMDAPVMMHTKSRWNAKMRDGTRRCAMEREDARWNAKMRENAKMRDGTRRCMVKREDARWNAKMHGETRRCAVKHEDALSCYLRVL